MKKCHCGNCIFEEYSEHYNKCPRCGTLVLMHDLDPDIYSVSDQETDLYGSQYWEEDMLKSAGVNSIDEIIDLYLPERVTYWANCLLKYINLTGSIAEIGCGMGQLSYFMAQAGFDVTAYELSPQICQIIQDKLKLKVVCGEFGGGQKAYSTVIAMDVFEHMIDPDAFLDDICSQLTEDGIICFQLPCYDPALSFDEMKLQKPRFELQLKEEQHIFLYSRSSIRLILEKHGFQYIQFLPAYFGDDYDMFLIASRKELQQNSDDAIKRHLYSSPSGRICNALITNSSHNKELENALSAVERNRDGLLSDVHELTRIVHERESEIASIRNAVGRIRIGINITTLYPGKIGGLEQYVRNLVYEMQSMNGVELYVFTNESAYETFRESETVHVKKILGTQEVDPQLLFYIEYHSIDVMFCPLFFAAPAESPVPVVSTIPDIQHEFYPDNFDRNTLASLRRQTADTIREADGIITISGYSKISMIEKLGVPASKIYVTYLNSDRTFDDEPEESVCQKIFRDLPQDYIFYPANTWPHKNHMKLLQAFLLLKQQYTIPHKLLLTGDSKQKESEISRFIKEHDLEKEVIWLGYREQNEMPYIFRGAAALVFPSLFEGFGIPLVEAMRTGTPIACANCGSLPEVAQDAALFFDPKDPADIARKVSEVLLDQQTRARLVEAGNRVAGIYSWEKCASDTLGYLRRIAGKVIPIGEKTHPLVSVITPSYNQGEFIKETIESVLGQDYDNIEYIVIDGGSTDSTVEILKSYGDRITWVSEKDRGQADAVNKGVRMAHGQLIGWLNSDDTYLDGAVKKAVDYFLEHPDTDMVYGNAYYTDKQGKITGDYSTRYFSREGLLENCFICQPAAFFTKDIFVHSGMLDISYRCSMDYELWMRIAKNGKISFLPEHLATSRLYEENKTLSLRDTVYQECFRAVKKHYGYVPLEWCGGYAHYKTGSKKKIGVFPRAVATFVRENIRHPLVAALGVKRNMRHTWLRYQSFRGGQTSAAGTDTSFRERYADGWLSGEYRQTLRVNNAENMLFISGSSTYWPLEEELIVTPSFNGIESEPFHVPHDKPFSVNIPIPQECRGDEEIQLCLKMSHVFIPANHSKSKDYRPLSFELDEIRTEVVT